MTGPRPGASRREPAPPPASSAKAGEDDVEARCALLANEAEGAFPEDVAAAILSLVRSERRRARAVAIDAAIGVMRELLEEVSEQCSNDFLSVSTECVASEYTARVRALGGEEG